MTCYERLAGIGMPALMLAALVGTTGCHTGGNGGTYSTTPEAQAYTGNATTTSETPGAGVGAQTSAGAAADVPEATQKGAGASDLTTGGEGATSTSPGASSYANAQPSAAAQTPSVQTSTNMALPLYQESLQVGKRQVNDGAVRIRKFVTTETVNQPVQIRKETVRVDRVPAGSQGAQGAATGANQAQAQPFQEQDIVIQLHHEEPVISKEILSQGEIVAQVQTQMQQTNVQGQIRREQVQVTPQGNTRNVVISGNVSNPTGSATGGAGEVGGQNQGGGTSDEK